MKHRLLFMLLFFTSFASAMEYTAADTLLMEAIEYQSLPAVQTAIKAGADVNFKHPKFPNNTPLAEAVAAESDAIVSWLLSNTKIDIEAEVQNQYRPLHIAVMNRRIDNVRLLLLHGARLDGQNDVGNTPLHIPFWTKMEHMNLKVARCLITCLPKEQVRLIKSCMLPLLCCFNRLKQSGGPVGQVPKGIQKLLCRYYVKANVEQAVDWQLDRLQSVLEIQNKEDRTPFRVASTPLKLWLELPETNQWKPSLTAEEMQYYAEVAVLLKPGNSKFRHIATMHALWDELNLASKFGNLKLPRMRSISNMVLKAKPPTD